MLKKIVTTFIIVTTVGIVTLVLAHDRNIALNKQAITNEKALQLEMHGTLNDNLKKTNINIEKLNTSLEKVRDLFIARGY